MPTWPATLPAPLIEGYTLQPFDNCSRVQMEAGHQRVRLEFEGDKDFLTVNWLMTGAQLGIFRAWFKDDVGDGAAWFDTQMDYDGGGLKDVEARFASKFTSRHEPPFRWRVSAKLEIEYAPLSPEQATNILLGQF